MKDIIRLTGIICTVFVIGVTAAYGQSPRVPQAITSGRVNTLGKFSFQYGRLDISVKIPQTANGLWPALWLLGADYDKNPRSDCGEIALFEMGHFSGINAGTQGKLFSAAAYWGLTKEGVANDREHGSSPGGSNPGYMVFRTNSYGLQYGAFHLITVIWNRQRIRIYLDLDKLPVDQRAQAKPYFEMEITHELEKYFCKPFSIAINLAVGGEYTGITDKNSIDKISVLNDKNHFQTAMYIDFVRVYNESGILIFDDEFNGSRLDSSKWNIETNDGGNSNQELQSYRRPNVTLGKDRASGKNCLILTAKLE